MIFARLFCSVFCQHKALPEEYSHLANILRLYCPLKWYSGQCQYGLDKDLQAENQFRDFDAAEAQSFSNASFFLKIRIDVVVFPLTIGVLVYEKSIAS